MHAHSAMILFDPVDCSPPGSSVHGISQARILEWVAISYSRESSQPQNQTHDSCVSCIGRRILCHLQSIYLGVEFLGIQYAYAQLSYIPGQCC